jgi:CHAT domain-containing protein
VKYIRLYHFACFLITCFFYFPANYAETGIINIQDDFIKLLGDTTPGRTIIKCNTALSKTGNRSGNDAETLLLKACLAYSYWNNCESSKAEALIQWCQNKTDSLRCPLDTAWIGVYLVMAQYYIFAHYPHHLPEKYLNQAAAILKNRYPENDYHYAVYYYLKGYLNYDKASFENAMQYFRQSLQIASLYPALIPYEHFCYRHIAGIYYDYDQDYEGAINYCLQKARLCRQSGQSPAFFYYIAALSYLQQRDSIRARKYLNEVISITDANTTAIHNRTAAQAYLTMSGLYPGNSKKTLLLREKGLKAAKRISSRSKFVCTLNRMIATWYYTANDYSRSLSFCQQAIIAGSDSFNDTSVFHNPAINDIRPYYSMIEALWRKAYILASSDPYSIPYIKSALASLELAISLLEQRIIDIDEENAGFSVAKRRKDILNYAVLYASYIYQRTGEYIYAEKAFACAEKSKMQVLLINTEKKEKLSKAGLPDSVVLKAERLNNDILDLEKQMAILEKRGEGDTRSLTYRLTRLYDQRDQFILELTEKYPAYRQIRYDLHVPGISEIRQSIAPDQVFLEYQLTKRYLITFVISRDTFILQYQQVNRQFRKEIASLRNSLVMRPGSTNVDSSFRIFTHASLYLYEKLIKPVYGQIAGKRLIIVPHNELTLIPFEVLISEDCGKHARLGFEGLPYLIREFPVVYAYSAGLLPKHDQADEYGSGIAVFLPDYRLQHGAGRMTDLKDLDGAQAEATLVTRISGGRLFTGKHCGENDFKRRSPYYRILHIASHTRVDEKYPGLSCFVMNSPSDSTEDGLLHAYELRQLQLNAQLVVLSGCSTGFGKLSLNEGLISLARSFFYAGVRTVAFTLWPVADHAGAKLTEKFYRGLKDRQTLDVAMRNAKLDYIRHADPINSHPYYWANYVIAGNADTVPFNKSPVRAGIILIGLVMGVTGYFFCRKFICPISW